MVCGQAGDVDRAQLVRAFLASRRDPSYLEIGVRGGANFRTISAQTRIGVDPALLGRRRNALATVSAMKARAGLHRGTFLFSSTSDDFFARRSAFIRRLSGFDCVLVDGLHTAEQAFRDVVNALEVLRPQGLIVMHDCNPRSETAALPSLDDASERADFAGTWNGDVWKAVVKLRTRRDLTVSVLDCDHGLGVVRRGEPSDPLEMSEGALSAMTYADLDGARETLLELVPQDEFARLIAVSP